ncbi:MAG: aminopeptidase P N-terminal domain-containing protein [Candidatus Kariarchaeaceae archaeon]|jgi:Xaa-Pro aminopeptidase
MFSIEEYSRRRDELMAKLGDGLYIIPGNTMKRMSNDVDYEFRQQTDFLYFTGFPEPNAIMVIEKAEQSRYILFVPKRDKEFEIWNGRRYGVEGAKSVFNAQEAHTTEEFENYLRENLLKYSTVYYPMGENEIIDPLIVPAMTQASKSRERVGNGPVNLVNPIPQIHDIRSIKSAEELEIMRESARISADAMTLAMKVTKVGMIESQVESVIEYHYAKNGAVRPAYPSIVGTGVNATILHYIENNATMKESDLLLIDAGAEYKGYASDITRTWPVNGKFTEAQRRVYNLVLQTQEAIIQMVKPGLSIMELHDEAVKMLTSGLIELGLLEGDLEENISNETYKRFFMHGLGHFLGMDVHDTSYVPGGRKHVFRANQYFTVEPGIYIPDEEDIPVEYRGIGIRIEDDILVTENGYENLTSGVVKSIEEMEAIIGTMELP